MIVNNKKKLIDVNLLSNFKSMNDKRYAKKSDIVTQSSNGLMSSTDKKNLDDVLNTIGDISTILTNILS